VNAHTLPALLRAAFKDAQQRLTSLEAAVFGWTLPAQEISSKPVDPWEVLTVLNAFQVPPHMIFLMTAILRRMRVEAIPQFLIGTHIHIRQGWACADPGAAAERRTYKDSHDRESPYRRVSPVEAWWFRLQDGIKEQYFLQCLLIPAHYAVHNCLRSRPPTND
jgi:hypothetical protein